MESPCRNICAIDACSGLCIGCLRSLSEIAAWSGMTDAARRAVLADLPRRQARDGGERAPTPPVR